MMRRFVVFAAAVILPAGSLLAQSSTMAYGFQQTGWAVFPGTHATEFHPLWPDGQSGPVLGKPLSGIEVRHTTQKLSDGSQIQKSDTSSFYRDDRGRMRTESSSHILIFDPVAGFTYTLDPAQKTYTKRPIHANATVTMAATTNGTWIKSSSGTARHAGSQGAQPATEDLGMQMVNGINARGSRVTSTIPAGAIGNDHDLKVITERWYSDDLQVMVNSSNSDPRFGLTTYNLTNISQAAPDPSLFQPPPDYVESSEHRR